MRLASRDRNRSWPATFAVQVACALLLATALVAAHGEAARAGAFNIPEGKGLAIVTATGSGGSRYFNQFGKLSSAPNFTRGDASAYVEYGITDWLMAVVRPDITAISFGGHPSASYAGFGPSEAGAQLRVFASGPAVFAVQGSVRLPGSTDTHNRALLGDTARSVDARALAGLTFTIGPYPAFVDAQVAYRLRDQGAPDEIHTDLTLGLRPIDDLLLLLQGFDTTDLGKGTPWFPRERFTHIQGAAVYDLTTSWSAEIAAFTTVFGRQSLRENGVTTGVWYRF